MFVVSNRFWRNPKTIFYDKSSSMVHSYESAVIPSKNGLRNLKVNSHTLKSQISMNATKQMSMMKFHGNEIAFEEINGKMMVNATQMAKPFFKKPIQWLRYEQSQDLIKTVSKVRNHTLADLQVVRKGGNNPGTWFQKDVALFFAQWLSPEFYLACNTKLEEVLTQQAIAVPKKYGIPATVFNGEVLYPYNLSCKVLGDVKYPKAYLRKRRAANQFRIIFGRNFITSAYLDMLKSYYDYKKMSNQLRLSL